MSSKNNLPTVSFIIPTLNAANVLEECLKPIVNQDYPKEKTEVIITDGGSSDTTLAIAKEYGCRIFNNRIIGTAE